MRDPVTSIAEAIDTGESGETVCTSGFRGDRRTGCRADGSRRPVSEAGEPWDHAALGPESRRGQKPGALPSREDRAFSRMEMESICNVEI